MSKFYLIRHGEKERIAGDPELTEIGKKQAIATGKYFKDKKIKAIYSSPLKRTVETAKHIASFHNLEVIVDHKLLERANWGDLPGQSFTEFVKMWQLCDENRDYTPLVGDSSRKAGERIEKFLHQLHPKHKNDEVVLVVHGGLIADFLLNVFPTFTDRAMVTGITECSVTIVNFDGKNFILKKLAETSHLL